MRRSTLAIAGILALLVPISSVTGAAELSAPPVGRVTEAPADCGPCGCLQVTYVYHAQMQSTYGLGFDPRNYDQTEPHFYLGPIRPYPHYFVDGMPVGGGSC
jgi:hypothetical protein